MSKLPEAYTADAEFSHISVRSAADLAPVISSCAKLRSSLLLYLHRRFSHLNIPPLLLGERSAHQLKQSLCLLVGVCSSDDIDIHTANLVNLIVLDLGEDKLLLDTCEIGRASCRERVLVTV